MRFRISCDKDAPTARSHNERAFRDEQSLIGDGTRVAKNRDLAPLVTIDAPKHMTSRGSHHGGTPIYWAYTSGMAALALHTAVFGLCA